ncbi:hypothetical protein A2363_05175 [Candidatus Gottesmanbacteria bacterium RIFOXYB1_FULL_47_11]|uniref:Uncharacterized protein n=1 Tax=Candidatus Gottesmanbacteria bacterium RIFOXYB1_FULL_47_11 TaxID=1798401 RepID=A0A1F6BFP8_9BACT|nr:MAG: hypothetical protein A2363_05175 [Candidatus Gottesmanbacteria bacterium RIFOXYB1_FULL_47_11]
MFNWNTDTKKWDKKSNSYRRWHLEQLINFGLNGEKISLPDLKKYWHALRLDPKKRRVLSLWVTH